MPRRSESNLTLSCSNFYDATLESPSIGTVGSVETNQSREAKLVRLPSWMRLKN